MVETNNGTNDVEDQPAFAVSGTTSSDEFSNTDGKELGYAMFASAVIGFISSFFPSLDTITLGSKITTIVLSSSVTCNCCCASDFKLIPVTRMYGALTLSMISTQFLLTFIYVYIVNVTIGGDMYEELYSEHHESFNWLFVYVLFVLEILTILFACLYAFKR
mmetsp:Transcript_42801/g.48633  ORF Transcript_42801/g.48633 Transcript_42801/m.48633 type:complete len:162 (+) Transcript_42801:147-632(+)